MTQPRATFISTPAANSDEGGPAAYFRREFTAAVGLVRATLRVTGIGLVEPHLNGEVVGDELLAPGWTSYRHRLVVSTHDVTERVVSGANVVGAVLGEGWAIGRLGWEGTRNHYADRPALYLELELGYADRIEFVASDGSFRAGSGGVRANGIYDGEEFDARLEQTGWDAPGFDATGWGAVEPFDWPLESLIEPVAPQIRRIEERVPAEVLTTPSGRTVVDFGQNLTGWVRIKVAGNPGDAVTLRHAEALTGGEIDVETLRSAKATDRYVLRGDGPEHWEPRFTFHGFRYVEVGGWPGEFSADDIRAVVVHSEMARTGWFETSNELVNRLHENVVWSMRGNFVGVPTDCPQRDERLGWTGDINAFAPTAAFLYDVRGVLGSWLEDLATEQREKGFVPWVVPDVLSTPSSPAALWSDVAVSLPWALYQEYGELEILRRAYPSMSAYICSVAPLLDEHGLWSGGFQFGDWLDPDAPIDNPAGGKTDRHLVASAYLCKTTRELARTAALLDHDDDASHFAALAERVRSAFRREYVTEAGRIVNESATAYAVALVFDLLEPGQRQRAGDELATLVAKAGFTISTGFAGTPLVTDALSSTGHLDVAYALLMQTRCPSFLYPVTMGGTTIWERWDAIRPDGSINPSGMTSLNHYALGAVASWLHRVVGGIEATEPGFRRLRISPKPGGGLTFATTRHESVLGEISVAWRIEGSEMSLQVRVPDGAEADVVLPLHPDHSTAKVDAGIHSWRYEVRAEPRRQYSMDTTLNALAADPIVWHAITAVFAKHLPGIPIDGAAPAAAAMTLDIVLGHIPGASGALRADLDRVITLANTEGELS